MTAPDEARDRAALDDWIARFLDESGERGSIDAFLARHPDAPPGLAAALARVAQLDAAFPAARRAPALLGDWQLHEELGRGGVARVWRASSPRHPGQPAALKQLDTPLAADPRATARFRREVDLLRSLAHPHLARLLDSGTDDEGVPWLVLELCTGGSLADWLDARRAGHADLRPLRSRRAPARAADALPAAARARRGGPAARRTPHAAVPSNASSLRPAPPQRPPHRRC
jgi:serine/threonine-protein kinase